MARRHVAAYGHAKWQCVGVHACVHACVHQCVRTRVHARVEREISFLFTIMLSLSSTLTLYTRAFSNFFHVGLCFLLTREDDVARRGALDSCD